MRWEDVRKLKASAFKRLVGVDADLFTRMAAHLQGEREHSRHKHAGVKRGPKPKLCVEDELMMMLSYYREYRTFLHTGATYGLSEGQAWRIITRTEKALARSKLFSLPGKRKLTEPQSRWEIVLVDVSEHPIERPKKSSGSTTRARRSAIP
jgi:hypothetical protein